MSTALAWCLEQQRWALSEHAKGNPQAWLGVSDLVAEEVLIRLEEQEKDND